MRYNDFFLEKGNILFDSRSSVQENRSLGVIRGIYNNLISDTCGI